MRGQFWAGLALALAAGCRTGAGPQAVQALGAPLVLISVDTLRSDHLPAYGYRALQAPALDALAADSIVFERAYSQYPVTLPSHASLFTGLLPTRHGVRNNLGYVLGEEHLTLAERLKVAGYSTGGVASSLVLSRATGIAQGFDSWDDPGPRPDHPRVAAQRRGDVSVALAEAWLAQHAREEKLFLFLHLYDPHTPYEAPEPYASRYRDRPYDGEIAFTDAAVGGFLARLKALGLYDRALVVFLSDHGEGLGEHLEDEHGVFLYREELQVPLMLKLPGQQRGGQRVRTPAALIDVVPTVLALLGLDHRDLPGAALLDAKAPAVDRPIYSETWFGREQYGWSELRSVIAGDAHYVQAPRPELFDLARDAAERRNLLPEKKVPAAVTAALASIGRGTASTRPVSREDEERLAALGYVGGPGGDEATPASDLPDPKDHIAQAMELWATMKRVGKDPSLAPELRVEELLGTLGLRREYVRRTVAGNILKAGRPQIAWRILRPCAGSTDPLTLIALAEAATATGRFAEARTALEQALKRDPDNAIAQRDVGILLLSAGQPAQARPWLEQALAHDARSAEAWNALGVVRAQGGDVSGAVTAWQEAVRADPQLADAWFNLALALQKLGDRPHATEALERYVGLVSGPDRARAQALLARLKNG